MSRLILIPAKDDGTEVSLTGRPTLVVGRDPGCDLVIRGRMVSRRHAVVERKDDGCYVRDSNSYNGTFVNTKRVVGSKRLSHGDEIRIANRVLRYFEEVRKSDMDETVSDTGSPAVEPIPLDAMDFAITTADLSELGTFSELDPIGGTGGDEHPFDISPDLVDLARMEEQEQRATQLRSLAQVGGVGGDRTRFLGLLIQFLQHDPDNPEALVLIETYAKTRADKAADPTESERLAELLGILRAQRPWWTRQRRFQIAEERLRGAR